MQILPWLIFLLASAGILRLSWRALRQPGSHGFYRFFAFEAILGLLLLNLPVWFRQPFALRQLLSWFLLIVSAYLAVSGFVLLKKVGQPRPSAAPSANLGLENTTRLVRTGPYRFIRHPLYASLICLAWGAALKSALLLSLLLVAVATAFLYTTARVEEAENLHRFGPAYAAYMRDTRMFIPFIF